MIREKVVRLMSAVVLGGCVLSMSACCSTHTLRCSPEAKKIDVNAPGQVMFNIAKVQYLAPTNVPGGSDFISFGAVYLSQDELRDSVMKAAVATYPKLFSTDPSSTPLNVTITRSAYHDDTGLGTCVSCMTLTIFPITIDENTQFTIKVKTDKPDVDRLLSRPVVFTSYDAGRMSFFPTGWIPASNAKGEKTWFSTEDASRKMMLDSCVHAVATALQQVNAEVWAGTAVQK
jgi:hypothetical protein